MKILCTLVSWYATFFASIEQVLILWQIQKGSTSVGANDAKSLKGAILDWITPQGQHLNPPLTCNIKADYRFHHKCTRALLCPAGLNWTSTEYGLQIPD